MPHYTIHESSTESDSDDYLSSDDIPETLSMEGSSSSDDEDAMDVDTEDSDSESPLIPPLLPRLGKIVAKKSQPKGKTTASEIGDIFTKDLDFGGAFCFEKTYSTVPNPTLRLAGAGHIGLPASSRDLLAIKQHSRPMKSGPRVTAHAEDGWKMEASQVAFDNHAWNGFLRSVVEEVCKALAIQSARSKPRCDLQKLWLQGHGSILPLHKEKAPNAAFATLIIILPCAFTGGAVSISHAGTSAIVDQSRDSLSNTHVIAWYNGLTPDFKPITSGSRLVLHYSLIHTTNSPCPMLPSPSKAIRRLTEVLTAWKTSVQDQATPRKIIYLLDDKYSTANLTEDGLDGRDAYITSVLKDIAQKSGFKLLLAHLELFARGEADCGPRQKWGRRRYRHSGNDSEREESKGADPSRVKFDADWNVEYELELSDLRTLDGTPLKDRIDFLEMLYPEEMNAVESIPGDLKVALKRGKPDSAEYDDDLGGTLHQWFRRSVLVICPSEQYSSLIGDSVSPKDALDTLRSSFSTNSTEQEMSLVECVLSAGDEFSKQELQDALQVVTKCACRWGDFALWSRAMDACKGWGGIHRVQRKGLLSALVRLPFDNIMQSVRRIMKNDKSQSRRIQFALAACKELKVTGLSTGWILKALQADIGTFTTLGTSELEGLVRAILGAGGMQAVEKHLIKALKTSPDSGRTTMIHVACCLQRELASKDDSCLVSNEERPRTKRAIGSLLSNAINDWKPFAIEREEGSAAVSSVFPLAPSEAQPPSPDVAVNLLKAAIENKSATLIDTLLHKLMALPERGGYFEITPNNAVRFVVFPTLKELVLYLERAPPGDSLSDVVRKLKRGLCQAVGGELDSEYVQDGLVSHFCKVPHDLVVYEDVCRQLGIWKAESRDPDFHEAVNRGIKHLLQTAMNDRKSQYIQSVVSAETILKLCAEVGVVEFCTYIFSKLTEQAAWLCTQRSPDFLISYLGPFAEWLSKQGHDSLYPSFPELSRVIVAIWRQKSLGSMPTGVAPLLSATDAITCACEDCVEVKSYLGVVNPYEKKARPDRMRKSDDTIRSLGWLGKKNTGLSALQRISQDERTLKQVLGNDEYRRVLVALHVTYANAPLPTNSAQGAATPALTASTSANQERPAKRRKVDTA
ncbi:hypothetical protein FS837_002151 [Tulasnella sp. UAMH 9824]|nr:hypothetical protein FS837_002151 [Tulasnella sp. UAMH 9824]